MCCGRKTITKGLCTKLYVERWRKETRQLAMPTAKLDSRCQRFWEILAHSCQYHSLSVHWKPVAELSNCDTKDRAVASLQHNPLAASMSPGAPRHAGALTPSSKFISRKSNYPARVCASRRQPTKCSRWYWQTTAHTHTLAHVSYDELYRGIMLPSCQISLWVGHRDPAAIEWWLKW